MRREGRERDPALEARRRALDLLARREHSVHELKEKLRRKAVADDAILDAVVEDLAGEGLVSDERFAEAFMRARCERGQGPLRIEVELRRRGVHGGLVDSCVRGDAAPDWSALARAARRRRFGAETPVDFSERARQARFLRMRGFTEGQSRDALGSDELS